jgi:Sel1 repeat
VVVAWSEHSIQSDWVIEEADEGKGRRVLVPVFLDAVSPPRGFRSIQAANLTNWSPERPSPAFDSFLTDLVAMLGAPRPEPTLPPPAPKVSRKEEPQDATLAFESGLALEGQDDGQAAAWYRKAADQGNALAQNNLGWMYENGRGMARDDAQAAAWYRKAADQGHEDAKAALKRLGQ